MTRLEAPFDDTVDHRRRSSRTTRHAVKSHLHRAALDGEALEDAVLPIVAHDLGRKASPRPPRAPSPGHRGGFKVWKTTFWKRRRRLWAERNAAERRLLQSD